MRLLFKTIVSIFSENLKYIIMKKFKTIDCWISVVLILFFAGASIADRNSRGLNNTLINGYFIVGSWHIISMITHILSGTFIYKNGVRYYYHWISFVAVITIPLGSFWILYLLAPFMAVFYTWICYNEVSVKMQRPLAALK